MKLRDLSLQVDWEPLSGTQASKHHVLGVACVPGTLSPLRDLQALGEAEKGAIGCTPERVHCDHGVPKCLADTGQGSS